MVPQSSCFARPPAKICIGAVVDAGEGSVKYHSKLRSALRQGRLIRRKIILQRALGLKIQGLAKLSKVSNQQMRIHLLNMFLRQCKDTAPDQVVLLDQSHRREALSLPQSAVLFRRFHRYGCHLLHAKLHDFYGFFK